MSVRLVLLVTRTVAGFVIVVTLHDLTFFFFFLLLEWE